MKTRLYFSMLQLLVILLLVFLVTSCKKDNDTLSVTDTEGNVYRIVNIGTQTWMAENLKPTKLNDGTSISIISDNASWLNSNSSGMCWFNNESGNKNTLGALYNWYTVNTNKLCPTGWHVPNEAEWTILINYCGGLSQAGAKLKEKGLSHWNDPNLGATDDFSFTALPSGMRYNSGTFSNSGSLAVWWTSSESDNSNSWSFSAVSGAIFANKMTFTKQYGLSVRCIKD